MPVAAGRNSAAGKATERGAPARTAKDRSAQAGGGARTSGTARRRSTRQADPSTRPRKTDRQPNTDRRRNTDRPRRAGRRPAVRAVVPVAAGIAWGVALMAVVATNSALTELLLLPVSVIAAASTVRAVRPKAANRKRGRSRVGAWSNPVPVAVVAAVALPLAALGGLAAAGVALALIGAVVVIVCVSTVVASTARPVRPAFAVVVAALAPGVAAGSVVLGRGQGANEAVALVAAVLAYDVGAFVMGHGRSPVGGPIGVVGGVVSVAVVAVFVAAVLDPPFSGARPWVLFGLVAALAPLGVLLTSWLTRPARLPALRRLDSLVLAGPAWVIGVSLLLHR